MSFTLFRKALLLATFVVSAAALLIAADTEHPSIPTGLTGYAVSAYEIDLSWRPSTDNVGVAGYQVSRDGVDLATTASTSYADRTVRPGTTYRYRVLAFDAAGNVSPKGDPVYITTKSTSDSTAPTVSMTAPVNGASVANAVVVSAAASDNIGVASVQFLLDGQNLGSPLTVAPYSITWDSRTVANGSHRLSALARDKAGNQATSAAVSVNVSNSSSSSDVVVGNVTQLSSAVRNAKAGQRIVLAPGTYTLSGGLSFTSANCGTATAPVSVIAQNGLGSVTIDANGSEEAFLFSGAKFVVLQGLRITGGAYHAIKVDPPSTDLTFRGNAIYDNTRSGSSTDQFSAIKGGNTVGPVNGVWASRVTIEGNEIYETSPIASNNFQGIDCSACKSWVVRGNYIHDIRGATLAGGVSVQFKSGSADTIIEKNTIANSGVIGISYGGFGTPSAGGTTYEHVGGVVRNNVIYGSADAGISVINNQNGKIYNNTLFNNAASPDVRVAAQNVQFKNNILDRSLRLRDGTTATQANNLVLSSPADGSLFVNASGKDFHLNSTASSAIDKGVNLAPDVTTDFDGIARPQGAAYDIGAFERH